MRDAHAALAHAPLQRVRVENGRLCEKVNSSKRPIDLRSMPLLLRLLLRLVCAEVLKCVAGLLVLDRGGRAGACFCVSSGSTELRQRRR